MTLYQKYRPKTFEDMIGNSESIEALKTALIKPNHSHAYLLSGAPGTGKTTMARIMATELHADEFDIQEINTATNRGIDTAREIMSQMRLLPMNGPIRVYILDECHKFTNDMQNALLKPLEDTPEHVYFFLCTTNPEKLIKAVRSRCTEVKTELLDPDHIMRILKRINKAEDLKVGTEVLESISDLAEGSPRKAIVMLEKVGSLPNDEKRMTIVEKLEVSEEDEDLKSFCRLLLDPKMGWGNIGPVLKNLIGANKLDDPESFRYQVLAYINNTLLNPKGKVNVSRAVIILEAFSEPTYNTGQAGITLACFNVIS